MDERRTIIAVQFQAGDARGNWNFELRDPATGEPMQSLSERDLDDAVFALNEMRNARPMYELQEFRAARARAIEHHFLECAQKLIKLIETGEGWDLWLDRLHKGEGS